MRRKIVAGNWKMNGDKQFAASFAEQLRAKVDAGSVVCDVMIAPPAYLLSVVSDEFSGTSLKLASQNVSAYESGAYTGDISSVMLKDVSCVASLVGHSERRTIFGETDADVVAKVERLLEQGIEPILCVGETLEERDAGQEKSVVGGQVNAVLSAFTVQQLSRLVIAYEPVWAIGTGRTASPEQAQEMHAHIRSVVSAVDAELANTLTVLYGGSVNSKTAKELFAQPDIDGGLVGGASLKIDEFFAICQSF